VSYVSITHSRLCRKAINDIRVTKDTFCNKLLTICCCMVAARYYVNQYKCNWAAGEIRMTYGYTEVDAATASPGPPGQYILDVIRCTGWLNVTASRWQNGSYQAMFSKTVYRHYIAHWTTSLPARCVSVVLRVNTVGYMRDAFPVIKFYALV